MSAPVASGRAAGRAVGAVPAELRDLRAFAAVAAVMIVAGGLVAAVNSAAPFAHGSWLGAYLVLVGGASQLALGGGRLVLPAPDRSMRLRHAQLALWNAGTVAVAVGVFTDVDAVVLLGSAVVLAALGCFALGGGPGRPGARWPVIVYRLAIGVLAVSVVVGSVLADAAPRP
jgi:hypothetical protein